VNPENVTCRAQTRNVAQRGRRTRASPVTVPCSVHSNVVATTYQRDLRGCNARQRRHAERTADGFRRRLQAAKMFSNASVSQGLLITTNVPGVLHAATAKSE
jgi:hypothetical protein